MPSEKVFTNELIGFLKQYDKVELEQLAAKYPQYGGQLVEGITLGDEIAVRSTSDILMFRLELCKKGLESVIKESEKVIPQLKRKLRRLKNVQFYSQVLVAVSSASILVMLGKSNAIFNMVAAGLALLGSLLSIYVQTQSNGIGDRSQSISKAYTQLVESDIKAQKLLTEVKILHQFQDFSEIEAIHQLINDSNTICEEVRAIFAYVHL